MPTGRAAYAETRRWLLDTHGPVCAYCGRTFTARTLTLDHVTPRRGQSAYDRRDNLVLACKTCNTAKADKSFLAWVLGHKTRARHLFVYGQHLSAGILDILRPMAGNATALPPAPPPDARRRVNGAARRVTCSGPTIISARRRIVMNLQPYLGRSRRPKTASPRAAGDGAAEGRSASRALRPAAASLPVRRPRAVLAQEVPVEQRVADRLRRRDRA